MKQTLRFPQMLGMVLFLAFCAPVTVFSQSRSIQGTIVDQEGAALPGVNVLEKGTTNGTTSDAEGRYSFTPGSDNPVLVFSFIGYTSQEVAVGGQSIINITLSADVRSLDEIVVVGYGTSKKTDLTGAVASADIEAFRQAPNVNIMQSLQGSVPGVQIGQVNQAGEEPSISVRGQSTIGGSTNPLIVVDGIIYRGQIGDLNPADVKSIDILKDPSSKAIFGAQAANGVILITTKSGGTTPKKPTLDFTTSISTQTPTVDTRLLGRDEWMQKVRDTEYQDAYLAPEFTETNPAWDFTQSELLPPNLAGIDDGTDFDWWDAMTSPGYISNNQLSLSGGSENTSYYVSGGYTAQKGFILNDDYKRTTLRVNVQSDVNSWLRLGINTFGSFTDRSGSYPNVNTIATTSPVVDPYNESGEFVINHFGDNVVNPFLNAQADDRNLSNNISAILTGLVKIPGVDGLTYQANYSHNLRWGNHDYSNYYDAGQTGLAYKINDNTHDVRLDNIVTYEREFRDHDVKVTFVAGFNEVSYDRTAATGENIPNLSLSYNSLEQAIVQSISSDAWEESQVYQMGRLNYGYKNRYILTATLRRDGFSGFAKDNKFGYFPSVGIGWVLSEEKFFGVPSVNFLKIRASYGENGNQTPRYSSLARVSANEGSKYVFGDGSPTFIGQTVTSLSNRNLSWETTTGLNIGIDYSILNERIYGNVEYYATTTTDLLWDLILPQATGFSSIKTNLGEIANRGVEVSLGITPVTNDKLSWDVTFNFSSNTNEIVSLLGEDNDGDGVEDDLIASGLFIGQSIGTIYDYEIDGLWQLDDEVPAGFFPGTYRVVDQNNDGSITAADDRKILGRREPSFRFGVQNTVRYKGFTFRFFVNSIQGGKNGYLGRNHYDGVSGTSGTFQNSNVYTHYNYWSPRNPQARYPQAWMPAQVRPVRYDSRTFVRLQDISLGYDLNKAVVEKIGINALNVYVSGKNLLTSTNWDGWDPETGLGVGNTNAFPLMKAYTLGLNVTF